MTQYNTQFQFKTQAGFTEAWMYLIKVRVAFRYCNDPAVLTVEAGVTGDEQEDTDVMTRLTNILKLEARGIL